MRLLEERVRGEMGVPTVFRVDPNGEAVPRVELRGEMIVLRVELRGDGDTLRGVACAWVKLRCGESPLMVGDV